MWLLGALLVAGAPAPAQDTLSGGTAPVTDPTDHSNQDRQAPGLVDPGPATPDVGAPERFRRIYVDQQARGDGDGRDWANAFRGLRPALAAAAVEPLRVEIWVARGVYGVEGAGALGRNSSFIIPRQTAVYGGFRGIERRRTQRDPNPDTNGTVLTGWISDGVTALHVVRFDSVGRDSVLDGFTVEGGLANESPNLNGAGAHIWRGSPTIRNVIFTGNDAAGRGGAVFVNGGSPVFTNVRFIDNTAQHGGAIAVDAGKIDVQACYFENNHADLHGGAIFAQNADLIRLRGSDLRGNEAQNGGALALQFVTELDDFSTLYSGNVAEFGGAIHLFNVGDAALVNVTLANNAASVGAALRQNGGATTIANAILWNNPSEVGTQIDAAPTSALTLYCSNVQFYLADGDIDENLNCSLQPRFQNPVGPDGLAGTADDNLRLQRNSPCIDAGDNRRLPWADFGRAPSLLTRMLVDADGQPRRVDVASVADTGIGRAPLVDLGAYEAGPDPAEPDDPIGPHPILP